MSATGSDVQERSTYAKGTPIYLTPQIKGKAGEVYTHFSTLFSQMNGRIRSPIERQAARRDC